MLFVLIFKWNRCEIVATHNGKSQSLMAGLAYFLREKYIIS